MTAARLHQQALDLAAPRLAAHLVGGLAGRAIFDQIDAEEYATAAYIANKVIPVPIAPIAEPIRLMWPPTAGG